MLSGKRLVARLLYTQPLLQLPSRQLSLCARCLSVSHKYHQDQSKSRDSNNNDSTHRGSNYLRYGAPILLLNASALLASKSKDGTYDANTHELAVLVQESEPVDIVKVRKLLKEGADPNYRCDFSHLDFTWTNSLQQTLTT